jgi:heterodisulfide reductase subunit A-like polyferredoxin
MRKLLAVAGAAAMIAGLSACGPHHTGNASAAASRAAASARAFASTSAAVTDKAKAKADVTKCITQVGVVKLTLHPVLSYPAFKTCLESKATNPAAFSTCVNNLVGTAGFGPGKLVRYESGLATCLVTP